MWHEYCYFLFFFIPIYISLYHAWLNVLNHPEVDLVLVFDGLSVYELVVSFQSACPVQPN